MRGIVTTLAAASCLACSRPVPAPLVPNGWSNGFNDELLAGALASDRLGADPALVAFLRNSPAGRGFLHYAVQCALPQGESVTLDSTDPDLTFPGLIGLAPSWATAACDEECQEWVSACMIARTNAYGVTVMFSAQGEHPAIAGARGEVASVYPVQEGAFYGNLFGPIPRAYACRGKDYDPLYMTFRRCSQPGNTCGIQNVGPCGDIDGDTGSPSVRHACSSRSADGIAFTECHSRGSDPDSNDFPEPSRAYARVITSYLPRSSMGNTCKLPDPVVEEPPPQSVQPPASSAGMACDSDEDCASDAVTCLVQGPEQSLCTAGCTESADTTAEATACGGPDATCLTFASGAGARSLCTHACRPLAAAGSPEACGPAQVCTGYWYTHDGSVEATGCAPFCRDDGDCTRGAHCNPRAGTCGAPVDDTLLEDGEPCSFDAPAPQCKGGCAPEGPPPGGICASFLHLGRQQGTPACPYLPERIRPVIAPQPDEVAICAIRACRSDADCTAPLHCRFNGPVGGCLH